MEGLALFSTPVFRYDIDDEALLAELATRAVEESQTTDGIRASNHGGTWHSPPDLARRTDDCWQAAARHIVERARETFDTVADSQGLQIGDRSFNAGVQMWAMVSGPGGYCAVHEHHGHGWSVALYAHAGDDTTPTGGSIGFVDPRRVPALQGGVPLYPSTFTVRPKTGMLLIFPGWLQHFVHPYQGTIPRVCLSANVSFVPA